MSRNMTLYAISMFVFGVAYLGGYAHGIENIRITPNDRLEQGLSTLLESSDDEALASALNDVVSLSHLKENADELLSAVDACLDRSAGKSDLAHKIELAKAQLLAKSGRWDEAKSLFDTAIQEGYDKAAPTYLECLTTIGKNKERAVEEFNLCVGKPSYLDYRGQPEDLSVFATVLLFARGDDPEFSAMSDVFPYLVIDPKDENRLEITRALCLATDGKYEESLKALESVQTRIADDESQKETNRVLPLYAAWVSFDKGEDNDGARQYLQDFYERNPEDPGHVLGRILRIAYYFERYGDLRHKIPEVTEYLLDSEMFEDEEIRAKLNAEVQSNPQMKAKMPADLYAHVLELHAHGLSWRYDWQNAVKIWDKLVEDYYPQTVTGASALMSKAVYVASKNNPDGRDALGAIDYLNDILENAPYDEILPHVLRLKAKYLAMTAQYDEAKQILERVIALIPPNPTPEFKECLEMAKGLQQAIPQMEEYKRLDAEYKAMKEKRKNETREEARERIRREMEEYRKNLKSNQ